MKKFVFLKIKNTFGRSMTMNVSNTNQTDKEVQIHTLFEALKGGLSQMTNDVNQSHQFFKLGIEDELANVLKKLTENPLDAMSISINNFMGTITQVLEIGTKNFFDLHHNSIERIYKTYDGGSVLHYVIILKDNSLKTKRPFYSFLNEYEGYRPLSIQFPILFDFIEKEEEEHVKKNKVIELGNDQTSKPGKTE